MLIEVNKKDLVLLDGLGVCYKKIGSVCSKFEDDEAVERVNAFEYYLDSLMEHHNIPSDNKDDLIKKNSK